MQPCVAFGCINVDTAGKTMEQCWHELVALCNEVPRLTECQNCIHKPKCQSCIAQHYYDVGEFGKPSPRLCYKCTHPKEAKEAEDFFAKNGYLPL